MAITLGPWKYQHEQLTKYLTRIPEYSDGTLINFRPAQRFSSLIPSFARVSASFNKKLRKGQLQTFEGLAYDKVTNWERLKAKLVEPPQAASSTFAKRL